MHTEMALRHLGIRYEKQKKFPGLRKERLLRFDFWLPELNTAIEYDGQQHQSYGNRWHHHATVERDWIKDEFCTKNGIALIRIPYTKRTIQSIVAFLSETFNDYPVREYASSEAEARSPRKG